MFSRWRLLIVAHFSPKIISLGKCVFITAVAKNYFWPSPLNLRASLNTAIEMIAHLRTRYNHARKHTNIILRKANCVLSSFSAMKIPEFFRTIDSVEKSSWTIWVAGRVGRFLFLCQTETHRVTVGFACNSYIDSFMRLELSVQFQVPGDLSGEPAVVRRWSPEGLRNANKRMSNGVFPMVSLGLYAEWPFCLLGSVPILCRIVLDGGEGVGEGKGSSWMVLLSVTLSVTCDFPLFKSQNKGKFTGILSFM